MDYSCLNVPVVEKEKIKPSSFQQVDNPTGNCKTRSGVYDLPKSNEVKPSIIPSDLVNEETPIAYELQKSNEIKPSIMPTALVSSQFTVTTKELTDVSSIAGNNDNTDTFESIFPSVTSDYSENNKSGILVNQIVNVHSQPHVTKSVGSNEPRRRKKTRSTVTSSSFSSSSETDPRVLGSGSSGDFSTISSGDDYSYNESTTGLEKETSFKYPLQIFRNLLVMEESLRVQYIAMAVSRRKHVLFFFVLIFSNLYFGYAMFINPSIYRLVNFFDQLMFMASIVILGLFYLTGLYTKAFVYSPRFIHNANKGLRPFNVKLVRIPRTWKEYTISVLWNPGYANAHGRLVKLILSARAFSPDIVEGWEIYRNEYWERENTRKLTSSSKETNSHTSKNHKSKHSNTPSIHISSNSTVSESRNRRPRRRIANTDTK